MFKKSEYYMATLAFVLLFSLVEDIHAANANDNTNCTIHYHALPPFGFTEKGKLKKGIYSDIMPLIFESTQLKCDTLAVPAERYVRMVLRGDLFLVLLPPSLIKKDFYYVSKEPLFTLTSQIYWNKAMDITSVENLKGRLVTMNGYGFDGLVARLAQNKLIELEFVRAPGMAKKMLLNDRAKYLLIYKEILGSEFRSRTDLKQLTISSVDFHFGLKKTTKASKEILDIMSKNLARMKKTGTLDEIFKRWANTEW